jgi:hypothetical protein
MMMMAILIIPDTCLIQHVFASACACMFVDRLYGRAELNNKRAHCIRVPARARPHQRCPAASVFSLRVLAGHYSTEVNWIR